MQGAPLYRPLDDPSAGYPPHILLLIFVILVTPSTALFILFATRIHPKPARHRSATVLVLGDLGRSPRMMYHTESLAKSGWETYVVGYGDTPPIPALLETPLIHLLHIHNPPAILLKLPWILRAPIRIVSQVISVLYLCLIKVPIHTEILLVQNPPSIPTLLLAQIICLLSNSKLIIDWHNTGYSILAMRVGSSSPLVKVARWFERTYGQSAYAHLFVTKALQEFLVKEWSLEGKTVVLHDRPPAHFHRTEAMMQHELFKRIGPTLEPPIPPALLHDSPSETSFTRLAKSGIPELRSDRPAFLFSSTSWTADEDFSPLLTALDQYQAARTSTSKASGSTLPRLVVIITGRGTLRAAFEAEVAKREATTWADHGVLVRCAFVPARDYPTLLGCADVGVSMHASSSGRDLPMKVVDMFGCGVPVLARRFECIAELVKEGVNGRVFETGTELGDQLIELLGDFPNGTDLSKLRAFFDPPSSGPRTRSNGRSTPRSGSLAPGEEPPEWSTWDQNWEAVMKRGVLEFRK